MSSRGGVKAVVSELSVLYIVSSRGGVIFDEWPRKLVGLYGITSYNVVTNFPSVLICANISSNWVMFGGCVNCPVTIGTSKSDKVIQTVFHC